MLDVAATVALVIRLGIRHKRLIAVAFVPRVLMPMRMGDTVVDMCMSVPMGHGYRLCVGGFEPTNCK
mgnify:CR=1 FL=1